MIGCLLVIGGAGLLLFGWAVALTAAGRLSVARDNQGENAATIKMRMPRRLAAL